VTKVSKTAKTAKVSKRAGVSKGAPEESRRPASPVIDAPHLGLLPRPEPAPDVLAAITAAAQLVWPRPAEPEPTDQGHDAWRFSGRWWAQPTPMRRARPWARF
jgi:hypothetical protein